MLGCSDWYGSYFDITVGTFKLVLSSLLTALESRGGLWFDTIMARYGVLMLACSVRPDYRFEATVNVSVLNGFLSIVPDIRVSEWTHLAA